MQNHVWIIEKKIGEQWIPLKMVLNRSAARSKQRAVSGETRIRKYVTA